MRARNCDSLWGFAGRADNGHTLGQHDLVSHTRVQISRAQKTSLGRMGVNPTTDSQAVAVDVVEETDVALLGDLAGIGCGDLGGYD